MKSELIETIQTAQAEFEPQLKNLAAVVGALKAAGKLAADEKPEALTMHKVLVKLQQAAAPLSSENLSQAVAAFAAETEKALDAMAFEFAADLRATFEKRGERVDGRPPTLVVGMFVLQMDIPGRKAQWFYGKEALTHPIPLSVSGLISSYDQQRKLITGRSLNPTPFLAELYKACTDLMAERNRRRLNLIEVYAKVILNRQNNRFWQAPSKATMTDYPRPLFVRDMVLLRESGQTVYPAGDNDQYQLRLAIATKNQADNPLRSLWLPNGPLDGDYYAEILFEKI